MSDIKMDDVFAGDLFVADGSIMDDHCCALLKDNTSGFAAKAAIHAINTHDAMQARIVELEKTILEVLDEHGDLADGDVCTLIKLKRVMGL